MQRLCEDSKYCNLEKFWKISKVIIHMQFFSISCKLEFILFIRKQKKKFKRSTFQEGKQFFQIRKLCEIFGKFWKMQCFRTFHTLGRVCVKISSSIAQKLLKKAYPPKKLFHPKKYLFQKSSTPKNGSSPKIVSSSKKVSPPKNVSPRKN